ncbi:signal peptide peptidase SppA, 67K type, partial [human gut metagenome]
AERQVRRLLQRTYSQGQYYLASAADRIYLQPEGGMDWSGLSTSLMFYKGLFDKLDLKAEVFRPTVCKYKSAVEPYILDRMSEANREQMQALVDSMWGTIAEAVAASRGIDVEQLNEIADKLQVTLPEDALKYGFVDGLLYEDQMKEVFAELGVEDDGEGNYNFVSLGDYASMVGVDLDNLGADRVAVVYADGQIVDGEGYGDAVYGNSLAAELADVRRDEKVKAVVVRVNSPGGSALASDVIWREMELLRARSPLSCRWAPMPPAADTTSPARLTSSS